MLKYHIAEIFQDQNTTIVAIFSINVDVFQAASIGVCHGSIEPVSVVICQNGIYEAKDIHDQNIPINQLCQLVPELQQYF